MKTSGPISRLQLSHSIAAQLVAKLAKPRGGQAALARLRELSWDKLSSYRRKRCRFSLVGEVRLQKDALEISNTLIPTSLTSNSLDTSGRQLQRVQRITVARAQSTESAHKDVR